MSLGMEYPLITGAGVVKYGSTTIGFVGANMYCTEKYVFVGFDHLSRQMDGEAQPVVFEGGGKSYYMPMGIPSKDIVLMVYPEWPLQGFLDKLQR